MCKDNLPGKTENAADVISADVVPLSATSIDRINHRSLKKGIKHPIWKKHLFIAQFRLQQQTIKLPIWESYKEKQW